MPMHKMIEYTSNYSETTGSLWFYSKDETTDYETNIANDDNMKSFEYQTKLLGNTNGILKNATIPVPLKYITNTWRSLIMPLIICEEELKLNWKKYCIFVCSWC